MTDNLLCNTLPPTVGHDAGYFTQRHCNIDCRGTLVIDAGSYWGYFVTVITQSHTTEDWQTKGFQVAAIDRPVIVERGAWIGSNSVLYNCKIGQGAIVAIGTVVRSQEVAPFVMVAGNPARVIARLINGEWEYAAKLIDGELIYAAQKWEVLE